MRRESLVLVIPFLAVLALAACEAYQAQHTGRIAPAASAAPVTKAAPPVAAIPSHEFTGLSDAQQIAQVRGEVEETKKNLERRGKYSCCVRPSCNQCLLKRGECHCRDVANKKGPCCGECTEAWLEGRGAIEGASAWELLERKKKMLDDAW
jgi:hypothetical protein